jgi:hypothetical protein
MRRLNFQPSEEKGAVLVIVAIMMIAILGFVVIVVDVGGLLTTRRNLVRGSDAAALAAAQTLASAGSVGTAQAQANQYATANVEGAVGGAISVQLGIPGVCSSTDGRCGSVTAPYTKDQTLFFAPILGFNSTEDVAHTSKAIWGVATTGQPIPFFIRNDAYSSCPFPEPTAPASNIECKVLYDDEDNAQWGRLNLDKWDVNPADTCTANNVPGFDGWVANGYPQFLQLKNPGPTWVCGLTGLNNDDWMELDARAGDIIYFPIIDEARDQGGSHTVYAVIGFAPLELVSSQHLTGQPGTPDGCDANGVNPQPNQVFNLSSFGGNGCPSGSTPQSVSSLTITKGGTTYQQGVDYSWSPGATSFTWINGSPNGLKVSFTWSDSGVVDASCGTPTTSNSAVCLTLKWAGPQIGPGSPGGGEDFGLRSVRLAR